MDGIKLNIGCGAWPCTGYINVDKYVKLEGVKKGDILNLPFKDNTVDYAEAVEVLEHLSFRRVPSAIKEVYRVMKPGGEFRFTVPNFEALAKDWVAMSENEFDMSEYERLMQYVYGNQAHDGEYHRTPFTPIYTYILMKTTGWSDFKIALWPKGSRDRPPLETQGWIDGESMLGYEEIVVITKK